MSLAEAVVLLEGDPMRMGLPRSYLAVSGFFRGVEASSGYGGAMIGFTEWLLAHVSGPDNWPWEKLVVKHALGEARASQLVAMPLTPSEDETCLTALYVLLKHFLQEQLETHMFLREVFWRYNEWLRAQEGFYLGTASLKPLGGSE